MTALKSVLVAIAIGLFAKWGVWTATATVLEPSRDGFVAPPRTSYVHDSPRHLLGKRRKQQQEEGEEEGEEEGGGGRGGGDGGGRGGGRGGGDGGGRGRRSDGSRCKNNKKYPECCGKNDCRDGEKCKKGMCEPVDDCDYPKCCKKTDCRGDERCKNGMCEPRPVDDCEYPKCCKKTDCREGEKCKKGMCEPVEGVRTCTDVCNKCTSGLDACLERCERDGVDVADAFFAGCCDDDNCQDGEVCDSNPRTCSSVRPCEAACEICKDVDPSQDFFEICVLLCEDEENDTDVDFLAILYEDCCTADDCDGGLMCRLEPGSVRGDPLTCL